MVFISLSLWCVRCCSHGVFLADTAKSCRSRLWLTKKVENPDDLMSKNAITNPEFPALKKGDELFMTTKGEELPFLRHNGDNWTQMSRVTGKTFKIPLVVGSKCKQVPGEQGADSCHKCHARSALHP